MTDAELEVRVDKLHKQHGVQQEQIIELSKKVKAVTDAMVKLTQIVAVNQDRIQELESDSLRSRED